MATITIKDVPEEVLGELEARAALVGQPLEDYLRARLIEMAPRWKAGAVLARIRERKQATNTSLSGDKILAYRDFLRGDAG